MYSLVDNMVMEGGRKGRRGAGQKESVEVGG